MAAPSANILFFVIFIITISCSCHAPVALAVPENGEVEFPSQSLFPTIPIIAPIINPIITPILGPILGPILPILPILPPVTLPNIANILPLTTNITVSIGVSVAGLLPNFTIPNATVPSITFPNVTLPNTTLPIVTTPPLAINLTITIPGLATIQLGANLLNNGLLSGLLKLLGSGGSTISGIPFLVNLI